MEKGSFHPSYVPFSPEAEERVKAIPLPNQMPKGIDFSEIPVSALKSSTLEALIQQNEDLMARLSVSLRRTNELEEKISAFERDAQSFRTRFETLKEQYLVLQEKDRMSQLRASELRSENADLQGKTHKLEKLYTDIFVQAQAFQKRLLHLERYRAAIRKANRGRRQRLGDLRELMDQLRSSEERQVHETQAYETKLSEARDQVALLREKALERDRLFDETVELKNRLVFETRQLDNYRTEAEQILSQLRVENSSLRAQVKDLLVEREGLKQDIEGLNGEVPHLKQSKDQLTEQVESLQALWNHKQQDVERLEEKNRNLQKLNQSISVTINQQRKEIHGLKNQMEQQAFESAERIKTLEREIELLKQDRKP